MNHRLVAIPPSMIREVHSKKRPTSIDLGLGEPTLPPDPAPLRAALAWVEKNGCPYSPNAGFPELRAAIAKHYAFPGLDAAEQVGVTVGSQEALAAAIAALCEPGTDEVLVIEPAYPLYAKLCELFGVAIRTVALSSDEGYAPRAEVVLRALTPVTRVIVLASPANPTGRVWPAAELRALADALAKRSGPPVYIVSDEVYAELYYGERPLSPAVVWPHTVVVSSLSKSCALTGLRVGWFIAPKAAAPTVHKAHQFLVSSTTSYGQRAAVEIFARPEILGAHRPRYVEKRAALLDAMRDSGLEHVPPDGAFYCAVKLRGPLAERSLAFALAFLDAKDVVVIPGAAFAMEGWVRLSFAGDEAATREGVARLAAFCAA
jgi:aspartate/methionine/tyrosine aminotransferase